MQSRHPVLVALLLAAFCLAPGPGMSTAAEDLPVTSIAAIVESPADYANREVTVVGTVTDQAFGYAGQSTYTIRGNDRRITVVSRRNAPRSGEEVRITGKVGFRPPDEEFTFPPVILERERIPAR